MKIFKKSIDWLFALVMVSPFVAWVFTARPFSDGSLPSTFSTDPVSFMFETGGFDNIVQVLPWFSQLDTFLINTLGLAGCFSYLVAWVSIVVLAWITCRFLVWFPLFVVRIMDKVFETSKGVK